MLHVLTPSFPTRPSSDLVKGRTTQTWLGVGVPGTVMGLEAARTKYGSMSRQQLMHPAIALARKGYVLRQGDVNILHTRSDDFAASPNVAAIFLDNGDRKSTRLNSSH